ncbi:MAG: glycosyltransferase family 39 protein, partial [Mycobacteriaceae bacterium]
MTTAVITEDTEAMPEQPRAEVPNPRWAQGGLVALLVATAVFYLWGLSASGYANSFYSAAVQAGSVSWKAFFYGSSDAANSITVDKPPASLWVMALSVRAFGLSSWSILAPQALEGVATVALLYAVVRRRFGPTAGLISGLVLALTPVAALMFRFNNPDALLTLLMVASVWALMRGVEDGRTRWLVLTGVFVGLGFLTKQMQVFLVLPALSITYLVAGPVRLGRRLLQLLAAGVALVASAGWWLAIVSLVPAADRPFIGGSQNNSILELTLGYNGFGRLSGSETGSVVPGGGGGGGPAGGGMWGSTGITRLFTGEFGGQITWLVPAALAMLVAGFVLAGRAPRTDPARASYLVWGLWLLVTGLTFSFMAGIFHAYYTVALAPAVGALVGSGAVQLWQRRRSWWASAALAATLVLTVAWAYVLLGRSPSFVPWLRYVVLAVGLLAAIALVARPLLPRRALLVVALAA